MRPALAFVILAAAVSMTAAPAFALPAFPNVLPVAQRGMHCPGGGRGIGDRVGRTYILQELQIVTRDADQKLVGFIYSGADGNDYIDLSPSVPSEKTRLMRDGEPDKSTTMMRYCFSEPWHA